MAQRTGAERFLASLAKAASTRLVLVLAAAVLLGLAGCGGGSGSSTSTGTAAATSPAQKGSGPEGGKQSPSAAEEEQKEAAAKVRAEGKGGKHGPSPATPQAGQEPAITPQQREESNVANISFSSPSLPKTESVPTLPATYTCDGKDTWPAFSWSGFPAEAQELVLFMMNVQPVNEKIFFDWAVAGLDPSAGGIEAGKLPAGAVEGKNSFGGKSGYSVCPPKGKNETFMLALYAVPKALGAKQGFDSLALREEVESLSRNSGLYAVSYER